MVYTCPADDLVHLCQAVQRDSPKQLYKSSLIPQTSIVQTRHTATQPSSGRSHHPTRHMYCTPSSNIVFHPSKPYAALDAKFNQQMVPPICLSSFNNRSLWAHHIMVAGGKSYFKTRSSRPRFVKKETFKIGLLFKNFFRPPKLFQTSSMSDSGKRVPWEPSEFVTILTSGTIGFFQPKLGWGLCQKITSEKSTYSTLQTQ